MLADVASLYNSEPPAQVHHLLPLSPGATGMHNHTQVKLCRDGTQVFVHDGQSVTVPAEPRTQPQHVCFISRTFSRPACTILNSQELSRTLRRICGILSLVPSPRPDPWESSITRPHPGLCCTWQRAGGHFPSSQSPAQLGGTQWRQLISQAV